MEGDDHGEAYTAIVWGVGSSHEMRNVAGAEAVVEAEGNMCGAVMQGTVALPGSEAASRTKGSRRNLGDLAPPAAAIAGTGSQQEVEETKLLGKARGVGRVHSTVEASEQSCGEQRRRVWREGTRLEGEGDSEARSGHSVGTSVSPEALPRGSKLNGPPKPRTSIPFDFQQEPGAEKPHAGICGGGAG